MIFNVDDSPYNGNLLAAFNACKSITPPSTSPGTGIIQLGSGIYDLPSNSLIFDTPGITIRGEGPGASFIRLTGNGDGFTFGSTSPSSPSFELYGGIEHLSIIGSESRTSGRAIFVSKCTRGRFHDLHIACPGHGMVFTGTTGVPETSLARWFISKIFIDNVGPTAAIWIQGGNDRYFSDIHIQGVRDAGSRGIVIFDSRGDWFTDIDVLLEEVGISLEPALGMSVSWCHFKNVMGDTCGTYGWRFGGQGTIHGIDCASCWAGGNGLPDPARPHLPSGAGISARGYRIVNGDGIVFTAPRIWDSGGIGMDIDGTARNIQVRGGWASANGISLPGTVAGVRVGSNVNGVMISGLRSGNLIHGALTQSYGIEIASGADNFIINDCDLRGNAIGPILNNAGVGPTRIVGNYLS